MQSPNMTNNISLNAFANEFLVPDTLRHGKPSRADCSFEEEPLGFSQS